MKKTTLIIAVLFAGVTTFAQDLTSKKGEAILPEAGEWAIGVDASPFLNYFGNFIGGDGFNNAPTFGDRFQDGNGNSVTVFGKMFLDANTAYRGRMSLGFGSDKTVTLVGDATDPGEFVEDTETVSGSSIVLGAGLEKRRGNTRLQGLYGAEAMIGLAGNKTTFEYGNDAEDVLVPGFFRTTEEKQGGQFMLGINAFIGAEYFIAPKLSIGGEYTWGINFQSTGKGEITTETVEALVGGGLDTDTNTVETGGASSFGIGNGINGNLNLRLMLHF